MATTSTDTASPGRPAMKSAKELLAGKLRVATPTEAGGYERADLIVCFEDGASLFQVDPGFPDGPTLDEMRGAARRLVACWNACAENDLSTEFLEKSDGFVSAVASECKRLLGERAELLTALRDHDGWLERTGHGADHPWRASIARVLAKCEPKVTG